MFGKGWFTGLRKNKPSAGGAGPEGPAGLVELDQISQSLERISAEYESLAAPIKALKVKGLEPAAAPRLKKLKQFNFYPRLTHQENQFFEKTQAYSYRVQRAAQLGAISKSSKLPPRVVSVKGKSAKFARKIGLPVPECEYPLSLDQVSLDSPCVIKPIHAEGRKCVYALRKEDDGRVEDLFSSKTYSSTEAFKASIREELANKGKVKDAWIREEMIVGSGGSPAETVDVKFYCFYGKVGLVLQVDRWQGRDYKFFDTKGDDVLTGKYESKSDIKPMFDRKLVKLAAKASKRIPWPHVRIDFLVSDNDCRFGEFTLRPGLAAGFNDEWDRALGKLYVEAQARLYEDFILGKEFEEYRTLLEERRS